MCSLNKVVEFIIEYGVEPDKDYNRVNYIVEKHLKYNTILILEDKQGITAIARWNQDKEVAHILECIVRPDKRSLWFIKNLIRYGVDKVKSVKKIIWERKIKYPSRPQKGLEV